MNPTIPAQWITKAFSAMLGNRPPLKEGPWKCELLRNGKMIEHAYRPVKEGYCSIDVVGEWPTWKCSGGHITLCIIDAEGDVAATHNYNFGKEDNVTISAPHIIIDLK